MEEVARARWKDGGRKTDLAFGFSGGMTNDDSGRFLRVLCALRATPLFFERMFRAKTAKLAKGGRSSPHFGRVSGSKVSALTAEIKVN
jgi:hypothetical protein